MVINKTCKFLLYEVSKKKIKFSLGGLTPSADMLRLIEEIHGEDDVNMQNSFEAYDGCRGKSNLLCESESHESPISSCPCLNTRSPR
jgi:hypothetical protein